MYYISFLCVPFIAIALVIWWIVRTNERLGKLERAVNRILLKKDDIHGSIRSVPKPKVSNESEKNSAVQEKAPSKEVKQVKTEESLTGYVRPRGVEDVIIDWIRENWMMKLGALLVIIGALWFANYAIVNNLIGPNAQITIGILIGLMFLVLGVFRAREFKHQGAIFTFVGAMIVIISVTAGHRSYGFFSPLESLSMVFLAMCFVSFVSVKWKLRTLSNLSLIITLFLPSLFYIALTGYLEVYYYLGVVILGSIWIIFHTGWLELLLISVLGVFFYSLVPFNDMKSMQYYIEHKNTLRPDLLETINIFGILLIISYVYIALFHLANLLAALKLKLRSSTGRFMNILVTLVNGLLLFLWVLNVEQPEWRSLVIVLWSLIFALSGFILFKKSKLKELFITNTVVALVGLGIATNIELDGSMLTVAYAIEALIISVLGLKLVKDPTKAGLFGLLMFLPILRSIGNMFSSSWDNMTFGNDLATLVFVMTCTLILGVSYYSHKKGASQDLKSYGRAWLTIASIYDLVIIWLYTHAVIVEPDVATMFSLVIYALLGLFAYFLGIWAGSKIGKYWGAILVLLVVARLLLVDVWEMELLMRVIVFTSIGFLLLGTAFININRNKNG